MDKLLFDLEEDTSYEVRNAQAIITINRPPLNWLGLRELLRLCKVFERLRWECLPKANVIDLIILRQALEIRHFCVGFSLEDHRYPVFPSMLAQMYHLFNIMSGIQVPIIAVVRGKALGGGAELAFMCDRVIATDDAEFWLPEVELNVFPPYAAVFLPRMASSIEIFKFFLKMLFLGGKSWSF